MIDESLVDKIKADLRQNYQFSLFSILPGLTQDFPTIQRLAKKIGVLPEQADQYAFRLVQAGLWTVQGNHVVSNFELLDTGEISIKDYLATTVSVISQLTSDKPYEFETLSVVTNRALIKNFIHKVNGALKDLYNHSQAKDVEKDAVFSWTHMGVIEVEKKKDISSSKDSES